MTLEKVIEVLEGELLTKDVDLKTEVTCAFGCDLISDILMCTKEPTLLMTGLTNPQVVRVSDMIDLFGIVFIRGKKPSPEIIEMANQRGLPLITTNLTMFESSGRLFKNGLRACKV